jgi:prepilin-type N-terminal cleavage/methylation domain-containing protein
MNTTDITRPQPPVPKQTGFTMLEMVIVIAIIAILAALITPIAVDQISQKRLDVCRDELKVIKKAIVGDPGLIEGGVRTSFGFVGDLGIIPASLNDLLGQGTLPGTQTDVNGFTWGWRGPYINEIKDPWDNDYFYASYWPTSPPDPLLQDLPLVIARVWSRGPNGLDDSGAGDDLTIDIRTDEAFSMISGNTLDECNVSVQFQQIIATYPVGTGTLSQIVITPALNDFIYNFTYPIPIGIRQVEFTTELNDTGITNARIYVYINNGPITSKNLKDPDMCN